MYLADFSLDNLSLMALTIATGFVVDDAIIVVENISRRQEEGMSRVSGGAPGAAEVMSLGYLDHAFACRRVPADPLDQRIVGRLFREFAMTLALAIFVSMAISLSTTPMMCALS